MSERKITIRVSRKVCSRTKNFKRFPQRVLFYCDHSERKEIYQHSTSIVNENSLSLPVMTRRRSPSDITTVTREVPMFMLYFNLTNLLRLQFLDMGRPVLVGRRKTSTGHPILIKNIEIYQPFFIFFL